MAEIKNHDLQEVKNPSRENFRNIKPENGMTTEKSNNFWNNVFDTFKKENSETAEADHGKQKLDDHGKVYQEGDQLKPNCTSEVHGYKYRTDSHGRVISAEGQLHLAEAKPDHKHMEPMDKVGKRDQKEGDQRGHLIGAQFGGSGGLENLSPMAGELNQKDYKGTEEKMAKALKAGAEVYFKVEPRYKGDSHRPSEYRATYTINGERTVVVFRNEKRDSK